MEDLIAEAKTLVTAYAEHVRHKRLDDILALLCEDAIIQMPDILPLEGKATIREFYEANFSTADYHFRLEFTDEKEVAELVFINGLMNREVSSEENRSNTKYDFSFILKKVEGRLKILQMRLV